MIPIPEIDPQRGCGEASPAQKILKQGGQTNPSIGAVGNQRPAHAHESEPRVVVVTFPFASQSVNVLIADFTSKIARVAPNPHLIAHLERDGTTLTHWMVDQIPFRMHYSAAGHPIRSNLWWLIKLAAYQLIASVHLFRIRKLVDGAIFYMVGPYAPGPLATCRLLGIPSVMIVTESLELEPGSRTLVARVVFGLRELSLALVCSLAVESAALKQSSLLTDLEWKILDFEVPRGTNFVDFRPLRPASNRPMKFGYVGRLTEQKGFLTFVQAASEVLRRIAGASCKVVGSGPLDAEARSLALRQPHGQVDYTRWMEHAKIPEVMNSLRLLVLPSRTEGLPTVIIEAMACGTPVLATEVGGIGEIIRERETGFVVHAEDPHSLAKAIERALNDPDLDMIAERARKLVTARFSDASIEANLSRLVNSLFSTDDAWSLPSDSDPEDPHNAPLP